MPVNREVRKEITATCRALDRRGWVANHDGNITVRLGGDRFLATPTATSKGRVEERDLLEVDAAGKRVAGTQKPFGELGVHLAIYRDRDDVGAVLHAHPPHATAIAASGHNLIEQPFIAEAVVSIGDWIPLVPFAPPGKEAAASIAEHAGVVDVVLVENHGVFSWGADVEQAYLRLELVEHLARIALLAQPLGGPRPLPDSALEPLLEKRSRAGLGKAADRANERRGEKKRVVACAPAPHADVEVASPPRRAGGAQREALVSAVREEVLRVLREGE